MSVREEISLLVSLCTTVYNQEVRFIVEMDGPGGPPVEARLGGCLLVKIKLECVTPILSS